MNENLEYKIKEIIKKLKGAEIGSDLDRVRFDLEQALQTPSSEELEKQIREELEKQEEFSNVTFSVNDGFVNIKFYHLDEQHCIDYDYAIDELDFYGFKLPLKLVKLITEYVGLYDGE